MKSVMFLVVVAVLAVVQASVIPEGAVSSRGNFAVGEVQPGDTLIIRSVIKNDAPNVGNSADWSYTGLANTTITAVRAIAVGDTRFTSAQIIEGGVGWNHVTLRVEVAGGLGYHYIIEVYGIRF